MIGDMEVLPNETRRSGIDQKNVLTSRFNI
jgi:hypothetical protein